MNTTTTPNHDAATHATKPRHIAFIMDGNGRWAKARNLPRTEGHKAGAAATPPLVEACVNAGIEAVTLYSFSTENWARSTDEVGGLMELYVEYLVSQRSLLLDNNLRFVPLGQREGLPRPVLNELDRNAELGAANQGMTLALALNYGSRQEITSAVQAIAKRVAAGELSPQEIEPSTIDQHLGTAGLPDPDLLVRTAGEMRLSNYLLWQISYAELYVTDTLWPDFDQAELDKALAAFASRKRRFGGYDKTS